MASSAETVPALAPPAGQTSNFDNPTTLMPAIIATATLVYLVSTASVAARLFVKAHVVRAHHIEDFLSYFAWLGLTTYTSLLLYIESYGLARHMWDVPAVELPHMLYYVNILYCVYGPTTAAAKLSALFQIKRIFASTGAGRSRVWWVLVVSVGLNGVFYLGLFLSYVFQCWPREAIWDTSVSGRCIDGNSSNLAAGILNLISDVEALLLPAWAIWHLNMPIRRKLNAYAVFGIGSLAIVIGTGGLYVRVLVLRDADFTWIGSKLAMLVIAEMAVVVMVACTPVLPRLYLYLRGRTPGKLGPELGAPDNKDIATIGGRGGSNGITGPKRSGKGTLASSLAKYLGPGGSTGLTMTAGSRPGMTELGARTSFDDHVELRPYDPAAAADVDAGGVLGNEGGVWRTLEVRQDSAAAPQAVPPGTWSQRPDYLQ